MGYRCSWIAVFDNPLPDVLGALSLQKTGERIEWPSSAFYLAPEHDDCCVVIAYTWDAMEKLDEQVAERLSKGTRALYFMCTDTVICTQLFECRDGRRTWSIEYDGSEGISEPEVCGELPAIATKVIAEQREDQTGEDDHVDWLYEITPKVGLFLTGFRHDQEFDADDALWELRPTS